MGAVISGWSSARPSGRSELINKVTQWCGVQDDTELNAVAAGFLDDVIKEMNSHLYEFNKMTEAGIALSTDGFVQLRAPFYKESLAYLVLTESGAAQEPLVYLPWVRFAEQFQGLSLTSGVPISYSLMNVEGDGKCYLRPVPTDGEVEKYSLTLEYYRRIPLLSEERQLDVPQEVETALVYGAQKRMAIHLFGAGHADVRAFDALEERAVSRLKAVDKRHPDQQMRFRLVDHTGRGRRLMRGLYTRLD